MIQVHQTPMKIIIQITKNRAIKGSSKKTIHTFGCCSRYLKCSDAKECVHEDKQYAKGCAYYSNLKNGKIFYGKNRNV